MTEGIVTAARGRLGQSPYFALRGIECVCRDGVVTLRRCLPSHYLKQITQERGVSSFGPESRNKPYTPRFSGATGPESGRFAQVFPETQRITWLIHAVCSCLY